MTEGLKTDTFYPMVSSHCSITATSFCVHVGSSHWFLLARLAMWLQHDMVCQSTTLIQTNSTNYWMDCQKLCNRCPYFPNMKPKDFGGPLNFLYLETDMCLNGNVFKTARSTAINLILWSSFHLAPSSVHKSRTEVMTFPSTWAVLCV